MEDLYANPNFIILELSCSEMLRMNLSMTSLLELQFYPLMPIFIYQEDIFIRHKSPAGMNYFSMNGFELYRVNAKTMFD